MMMMNYPVRLIRDTNDTWRVECPDLPEVHTFGETKADALRHAADAIATALEFYIRNREPIPQASKTSRGHVPVMLSPMTTLKVQIYQAMREQKVSKSTLARRLACHLPQVDRLLDLRHASRLDQLEAAAQALGGRIEARLEMTKAS